MQGDIVPCPLSLSISSNCLASLNLDQWALHGPCLLACPPADLARASRADELETEVASARSELGQEVEELRNVLNATLQDKAQLASQCSAVEAQVYAQAADKQSARLLNAWCDSCACQKVGLALLWLPALTEASGALPSIPG